MQHLRALVLAVLLLGMTAVAVGAQSPSPTPGARTRVSQSASPTLRRVGENVREAREEVRDGELREARTDARCAALTAAINIRINRYNERKENQIALHQRIHDRLQELIKRLEEKGYDVTVIRADLVKLDEMIKKANDDFQVFMIKLEMTKQYNCGDAQGDFMAKLAEAKAALAVFRADLKEITTFIKETLKPHVRELRAKVQSSVDEGGVR